MGEGELYHSCTIFVTLSLCVSLSPEWLWQREKFKHKGTKTQRSS